MAPLTQNFIICVSAIVAGIMVLKAFFTLWGVYDRKLHPNKVIETPETAFKDLKKKSVTIRLKDNSVLSGYTYVKTLFFNDGEMAMNTAVYFQLKGPDGLLTFVSGQDILQITETGPNKITDQRADH